MYAMFHVKPYIGNSEYYLCFLPACTLLIIWRPVHTLYLLFIHYDYVKGQFQNIDEDAVNFVGKQLFLEVNCLSLRVHKLLFLLPKVEKIICIISKVKDS